jgi:DNA topoisomerase-2
MSKATDYDKKTPIQHILDRPDTYVGDIEKTTDTMDVVEEGLIVAKVCTYVPGFLKIFDEIMVNSSDAAQNDASCDTIKVYYNMEEGYIRVFNNCGKSIPILEHPVHKSLIPSMIFGELLTSSNYDDTKKRTTGGRNGYGAKLCNVLSTSFKVDIGDCENEKCFSQTWRDNMSIAEKPSVKKYTKKTGYVDITFHPDLKRFGLESLDDIHMNLFHRRAIDIAGISNGRIKVFFNDVKIEVNNFKQYISMYYPTQDIIYDDSNERWQVGCIYLPDSNNRVVSFVNSISTHKGGTHVNHVTDKVLKPLIEDYIKKKNKDIKVTPSLLKENLVFFVNSLIENPQFSSQSKSEHTTKANKFGSIYEPPDTFMKKLAKSGIVEHMVNLAKFKESNLLKKNDGKKQVTLHGIPKLEDANKAGGKESYKCSLILTEGDSAKAFAMAGLSIVGRDYYGVFPLKGKLLNAREAPIKQLMANEEINNIIKIMGLKHGEKYDTEEAIKTLRYERIICLTDQDVDGSHIKGLVINFFHHLWPNLIKKENFITSFATPIVKAFKGKVTKIFYNLTEYNTWAEKNTGWKIKYYKGLGTSTSEEAKEYFKNIEDKLIRYFWAAAKDAGSTEPEIVEPKKTSKRKKSKTDSDTEAENVEPKKTSKRKKSKTDSDTEAENVEPNKTSKQEKSKTDSDSSESIESIKIDKGCDDAITLAFMKSRADDRKVWLYAYNKDEILTYEDRIVSYSNFVHLDLKHFSNYDNSRSLPHIMDGFKPSHRKILYGCFLRKLDKEEVKVAQLAGFVSDRAAYHHGEASLDGAIKGMAQNFIGSNNINLLEPNGQFGTRLMGGKDAAAGRYIWTKLTDRCLKIFNKLDNDILERNYEDGEPIEPEYYAPIIPMILVNGSEGIGTGFSTYIPSFNPVDIVANLLNIMDGNKFKEMKPYWENFTGTVKKIDKKTFEVNGVYNIKKNKLIITELPVGTWTQNYKDFLEKLYETEMAKPKDDRVFIGFKEFHTDTLVHFELEFVPDYIETVPNIMKDYHLTSKVGLTNMTLYSVDGNIRKYSCAQEIMLEYYAKRLYLYEKRKQHQLDILSNELAIISNKVRFILMVIENKIVINNRKKVDIEQDLVKNEFPKLSTGENISYDYLLGMPIYQLTFEKLEKLKSELDEKTNEYKTLEAIKPIDIWKSELLSLKL